MRLHILGICGTFMGSLAQLAKARGDSVSGSDAGVYPPMSDQLIAAGIELTEGFDPAGIPDDVDLVIVGNAMSRGNPSVEYVLDRGIPYTSGPQWLSEYVLRGRWVLSAAGTHGKTSTASMLAWILEYAGMEPGYLIGGVPQNFDCSARLGSSPFFVIEADEYDTAFFDKRSKFVHYQSRTLIMNNLEFDHADIFANLDAIETQFHHLVRTVPASGQIILPNDEPALERVLDRGCWTPVQRFGKAPSDSDAGFQVLANDGSHFVFTLQGTDVEINWSLTGEHNVRNACAAMLAARHVGVKPAIAAEALGQFQSVKRRMELLATAGDGHVYDDFAHHPTAIEMTLAGLVNREHGTGRRVIAVIEPRSNTMKMGIHQDHLIDSARAADKVYWFEGAPMGWPLQAMATQAGNEWFSHDEQLLQALADDWQPGDQLVFMSNGGFGGVPRRFAERIARRLGETE
ncbi:MAG: UDP-N-acetylmuramate:L-alanyl-gamma-D-glutamyl-meso-diaminopimelate ligase [Oceanospirillaceae bacterium]|nr:UDP-N-acetylmuramate:L-alanyl-gamma-D-glutamyl-meso-diaminopimelate ligase [Oceanospirillaceae bacterium]|tara:strand:- start:675 stop:2051 length:1377 start_codon:yes stop_codon:yes gene_type:complete